MENKILLAGIAIIAGLVISLQFIESELDIQENESKFYCEMVDIYLSDPAPIDQRLGWPPYDSEIDCSLPLYGTSTTIAGSTNTSSRGKN
tara:strand:+ start:2505 stop:2774 length:270 start_codon:yes stop_codon:yes gene_type:complete